MCLGQVNLKRDSLLLWHQARNHNPTLYLSSHSLGDLKHLMDSTSLSYSIKGDMSPDLVKEPVGSDRLHVAMPQHLKSLEEQKSMAVQLQEFFSTQWQKSASPWWGEQSFEAVSVNVFPATWSMQHHQSARVFWVKPLSMQNLKYGNCRINNSLSRQEQSLTPLFYCNKCTWVPAQILWLGRNLWWITVRLYWRLCKSCTFPPVCSK